MGALTRTPEPELMLEHEQARAYSEADFADAHDGFVDAFRHAFPDVGTTPFRAIDLGCGPADVTARFARAYAAASLVGIDGSPAMLELARDRLRREGLVDRIELRERRLPDSSLGDERFDVVLSNSLLHHLADPADLWRTVAGCAVPGAPVLVMDLCRPDHDADVDRLVQRYAAGAPAVLQRDFAASLRAAYRPDEVARQLADADLPFVVEQTTDRHLVVRGRR